MVVDNFLDYTSQTKFSELLKQNKYSVIYFYIHPLSTHDKTLENMAELSNRYPKVKFACINSDRLFWIEDRFGISFFPIMLFFRRKEVVYSIIGGASILASVDDSIKKIFSLQPFWSIHSENACINDIRINNEEFTNKVRELDIEELSSYKTSLKSAQDSYDLEEEAKYLGKIADWYSQHGYRNSANIYHEQANDVLRQFAKQIAMQYIEDVRSDIPSKKTQPVQIRPFSPEEKTESLKMQQAHQEEYLRYYKELGKILSESKLLEEQEEWEKLITVLQNYIDIIEKNRILLGEYFAHLQNQARIRIDAIKDTQNKKTK